MLGVAQRMPGIAAEGQAEQARATPLLYYYLSMPAQRPAEVLGTLTHAQLTRTCHNLHYALCQALVAGNASSLRHLYCGACLSSDVY